METGLSFFCNHLHDKLLWPIGGVVCVYTSQLNGTVLNMATVDDRAKSKPISNFTKILILKHFFDFQTKLNIDS